MRISFGEVPIMTMYLYQRRTLFDVEPAADILLAASPRLPRIHPPCNHSKLCGGSTVIPNPDGLRRDVCCTTAAGRSICRPATAPSHDLFVMEYCMYVCRDLLCNTTTLWSRGGYAVVSVHPPSASTGSGMRAVMAVDVLWKVWRGGLAKVFRKEF